MSDSLFEDLPPPSNPSPPSENPKKKKSVNIHDPASQPPPPPLKSALKSALKQSALKRPQHPSTPADDGGTGKRLRFKTTTDASETQLIEAMKKIASHIQTPSKFGKASKLAIQLIEAKSVNPANAHHFFTILEAAMSSSALPSNDASLRSHYTALFSAAQDTSQFLSNKHKNDLSAWTIRVLVGNDLHTDDSFVFSKAANRVRDLISTLPKTTEEDDQEEAAALNAQLAPQNGMVEVEDLDSFDPFGLDDLLSSKGEKDKGKDKMSKISQDEQETKRFLKLKREALIICLEIAAKRYKLPWCQTVVDILAKHAFDNVTRFTLRQREAIEKLWASVHEQHVYRKQGKSVSGKLDMNGFEWLQEKYANEKISIRRAVGGNGERRTQQWLG